MSNGHEVDKEVARQAGRHSYAKLLGSGARIFEYDRTMLHAKVLLVDDRWPTSEAGTSTAAPSTSTWRSMSPSMTPIWSRAGEAVPRRRRPLQGDRP